MIDLQLFADEGGADAGAVEAPAAEAATVEGSAPVGGEAAEQPAGGQPAAEQQQGSTLLGGAEQEAAWDFRSSVPEGMVYDEQSAAAFSAIAREAGLTGEQAQKLAAYGMQYARDGISAMREAQAQQIAGWAEQTKKELGSEFDATVRRAGTGIEAIERSIPGIRQALNETGAGNRIELVKAFALVGQLVGEDNFRGFGTAAAATTTKYPNTNFDNY